MKIYAIVKDDMEWDEVVLSPTIQYAQKCIVESLKSDMRVYKNSDPRYSLNYEIVLYTGDDVLEFDSIVCRLRHDIPFEEWREMINKDDANPGQFFIYFNK